MELHHTCSFCGAACDGSRQRKHHFLDRDHGGIVIMFRKATLYKTRYPKEDLAVATVRDDSPGFLHTPPEGHYWSEPVEAGPRPTGVFFCSGQCADKHHRWNLWQFECLDESAGAHRDFKRDPSRRDHGWLDGRYLHEFDYCDQFGIPFVHRREEPEAPTKELAHA